MCLGLHQLFVMRHSSRPVTDLHDGLEIERRAIPQRELSAAGACQTTSTIGCPSHSVDRVFDFVQR